MTRADFRRQIDQLKASISLKDLVERDGHKLFRNGSLWKCCCPFHNERTPSFVIYPDNHAHCFGCHFHADIFQYVMEMTNCDFKTAVERLSNGSLKTGHVPIRRPVVKKEPEFPQWHFENIMNRYWSETEEGSVKIFAWNIGVNFQALNLLLVGHKSIGVWAFPMRDGLRKMVGIRYREDLGKKWAEKGSRQGLFIPKGQPESDLYITEGPTDCAAMLSMGLFAIGKASAMQGPEEIIKFIQKNRIRRVIVIADNDTAGLNGAKKLIDVCPVPCCELVLPAKDAREFYRNGGTRELIENLLKSVVWRRKPNA